jgi:hypothetical protein
MPSKICGIQAANQKKGVSCARSVETRARGNFSGDAARTTLRISCPKDEKLIDELFRHLLGAAAKIGCLLSGLFHQVRYAGIWTA